MTGDAKLADVSAAAVGRSTEEYASDKKFVIPTPGVQRTVRVVKNRNVRQAATATQLKGQDALARSGGRLGNEWK